MNDLSLRVYFKGDYIVNVPTANNNNVDYLIDPDTAALGDYWQSQDDESMKLWLRSVEEKNNLNSPPPNPPSPLLPSYWNWYGTNDLRFENAVITGADIDIGETSMRASDSPQNKATDPVIGSPIKLLGHHGGNALMVDLDSTVWPGYSTQMFSGQLVFGPEGHRVCGDHPTRAYLSWVWGPRMLQCPYPPPANFCAVFRAGITAENLNISSLNAAPSPILDALRQAKEQSLGIAFLYCLYFTTPPPWDTFELAAQYQRYEQAYRQYELGKQPKPKPPFNPKPGKVIGAITLWDPKTEVVSEPSGRLLLPPDRQHHALLGPAWVEVDADRHRVLLNLINTVPEAIADLSKVNLGELHLTLEDGSIVCRVPYERYDKVAYERSAGFVEVPIEPGIDLSTVTASALYLRAQTLNFTIGDNRYDFQNPVLREEEYVVRTDDRCVLLDLSDNDLGQPKQHTNTLHIRRWGQPAPHVTVHVGQSRYHMPQMVKPATLPLQQPQAGMMPLLFAQGPVGMLTTPEQPSGRADADLITDAYGEATYTVEANATGTSCLYYWIDEQNRPAAKGRLSPDLSQLRWTFFSNVRALPDHSRLAATPEAELTWELIYNQVLRTYYLLFPGMSAVFPLNRQQAVIDHADPIRQRTDPKTWLFTSFMPISRDLSAGKRKLLLRWLQKVKPVDGTATSASDAISVSTSATPFSPHHFTR